MAAVQLMSAGRPVLPLQLTMRPCLNQRRSRYIRQPVRWCMMIDEKRAESRVNQAQECSQKHRGSNAGSSQSRPSSAGRSTVFSHSSYCYEQEATKRSADTPHETSALLWVQQLVTGSSVLARGSLPARQVKISLLSLIDQKSDAARSLQASCVCGSQAEDGSQSSRGSTCAGQAALHGWKSAQ